MERLLTALRLRFSSAGPVPPYAWAILAVVSLFQIFGISLTLVGGIMVPLLHLDVADGGAFGWSPSLVGIAIAAFFLVGGFAAPLCGALGDRFGGRPTLAAQALCYGGGMTLMAFLHHEWQLFVGFSLILSLAFILAVVPVMSLVNPWFRNRLGLAIGILWASSAIGAALITPVMIWLLESWGWTQTFLALGLGGGGLMLALVPLYRRAPSGMGRRALVVGEDAWISERLAAVRAWNIRNQMRRTYAYWMLPVIHGLGCGGHSIVLTFIVDYYVIDGGWDAVSAALLLTITQIFCIPSRLLAPLLAEYMEGRVLMSAVLILQGLPIVALYYAQDMWVLYAAAAVFGIAYGGEASVYPVINRKYFGYRLPSSVYGRQMFGALLGSSIGIVAAGFLIDYIGYSAGLALALALNVVGAIVVWKMESTRQVLVSEDAMPAAPGGAVATPSVAPDANSATTGL